MNNKFYALQALFNIILFLNISIEFSISQIDSTTNTKSSEKLHISKLRVIEFNTGVARFSNQDETISPFIYRGITVPVKLNFSFFKRERHQNILLAFEKSNLKSDIPDYKYSNVIHEVQTINFIIRYDYSQKILRLDKLDANLYIGGGLELYYNIRTHIFYTEGTQVMVDGFNSATFNFFFKKNFSEGKYLLNIYFGMPFLSWTLMPNSYQGNSGKFMDNVDYKKNLFKQLLRYGEMVSLNKLLKMDFDISYTWFIKKHFGLSVKWCFNYYDFLRYKDIIHSKTLDNQFMAGMVIKL